MQGISIFQQIYAPRVAHVVTGFDGVSHNTHSPYAIGGVVGSVGKMTAIVANDQADTWHIVNLKCGKIFDAVAVLGAFDESEAANMAMRYHGQYFDAVCGDVCESNTGGLQRFLNHPVYMRTNRPVYAEELAKLQDVPSTQAILWDGVQLKSHNGSSKHLLLDMMRCDDDKALLEKMDFVEEESQLDGEIAEYDALVVEAYKLENTVSKLALAMDKATSISTLKVANQTLSKPKTMRGFGVIQQLVSFELSDGQAVSIIFNVSDSEANASAKMTKDDLLVAWKYKLNSRDITAAVQPNATQNVSLNMIASRIMGLADANSEKFVAAQKKKDAMQTELANTNQQVKDLQGQEQALLQEIADLQKRLDEKAKKAEKENAIKENQVASQMENNQENQEVVKITYADVTGQTVYAELFKDMENSVWILKSSRYASPSLGVFKPFGIDTNGSETIKRFNTKQDAETWAVENGYILAVDVLKKKEQSKPITLIGKELENPTLSQERPSNWRTNLANARAVAKSLGIETKGKKLVDLLTEIDQKDTVPKATTVSNKKSVFEALTQYGWSLDPASIGISKTFAGLAEAGAISDGSRTLHADFDSRERYLAVTDNDAPTGGKVIPETEIDLRDYGYDAEGFAKAAKAFNEKVEVYVLERRKLVNTPKSSEKQQPVSEPQMTNPDRDYLQSIIDGVLIPKESDMDTVIELAEKYENDEFITPLLEQALEVINQTQQAAVKGVV